MSNFLFDLDETLVGGDIVSATSVRLLKDNLIDRLYTNRDVKNYNLSDLPSLLRQRVISNFSDPEYVWYKQPIPGALYFLKYLESLGHSTGILTARPAPIHAETVKFLRARFQDIEFDLGINFVNDDEKMKSIAPSKTETLSEINSDYYFDDNIDYCKQAQALNIKTFLISNKHTAWNHEFALEQKASINPIEVLRNVAFFPETRI
jgi:FMN phosphatase YigB (HAD superfamily)